MWFKASVKRALPRWVNHRRMFRKVHGRALPLTGHSTYSEKIAWRIAHDRRALFAPTCDKLAMKAEARRRAGDLVRVPRTLWHGTDVRELARVDLAGPWVLKPNHSSQLVHFGEGPADPAALERVTAGWLEEAHWKDTGEWAYRLARPLLLVEEQIGVPGTPPADIKVLTFHGVPRWVTVHLGRFSDLRVSAYTPAWEPVHHYGGFPQGPEVEPPARLAEMLEAAARLSAEFDMLRVDFFEHDGVLWFGELTPYPGAGMTPMARELDEWLGSWWTLPPHRAWRAVVDVPPPQARLAA